MVENGVINRLQLWLLVVNFTIGSALLIIPSSVVTEAKEDAWLSMLLAIGIGGVIQLTIVSLANKHPDKTLVGICEDLLGKIAGKALALLYAWFFLHLSALVIRNAVDFIKAIIMPDTPAIVFSVMAGVLIFFTVNYGIETLARSNQVFTLFVLIGFWVTIFLVIPFIHIENLQPFLANGFNQVLRGTIPILGFPYAELVVFLMFFPYVNNRKKIKQVFITAGVVGGLNLFIVIISSILVLGANVTDISIYATYNMARLINVGDFLTRVEAVIALSYVMVIFTKIVVSFYGGVLALTQIFNLTDYRAIVTPVIIIVVSLSMLLNDNIVEVLNFASKTWTPYAMLFGFFIPLMLLVLSFFRGRKELKNTEKTP